MVKYLYPLLDLNFMKIYQTSFQISGFEEPISHAPLVIVDGNISEEAIKCVCDMCATHQIPGEYTTNWSNPPPRPFQFSVARTPKPSNSIHLAFALLDSHSNWFTS